MSEAEPKKTDKADAAKTKPAAAAVAAKPDAPERFIPASESRFMTSVEYKSPLVWYCPEAGTPFEHLLRPEYWASIKKMPVNAHVYVDAEDASYWAELKVLKTGQGFAKVMVLRHIALADAGADPAIADGYEIQFRGPILQHRVVRLKDGQVVKQGLTTHDDAVAWLRDHKRMLAA